MLHALVDDGAIERSDDMQLLALTNHHKQSGHLHRDHGSIHPWYNPRTVPKTASMLDRQHQRLQWWYDPSRRALRAYEPLMQSMIASDRWQRKYILRQYLSD